MDPVNGIKTQPHLMALHFLLKLSLFYQGEYIFFKRYKFQKYLSSSLANNLKAFLTSLNVYSVSFKLNILRNSSNPLC